MKRIVLLMSIFMIAFMSACTNEPTQTTVITTSEEINFYAKKIMVGDSEDYYILRYYDLLDDETPDYSKSHYEIYDVETRNLLHSFSSEDISKDLLQVYVYHDYMLAYTRNDSNQYMVSIYDISKPTLTLIKEYFPSDAHFSMNKTDHYLILSQKVSSEGNLHQSILKFLDLNDLTTWGSETTYTYTIESEDDFTIQLKYGKGDISSAMYAVYRYGNQVYYIYRSSDSIDVYSSDIQSLFDNDNLIYSGLDITYDDRILVEDGLLIHGDYNEEALAPYLNIYDLHGDYLNEDIIYFQVLNRCRYYGEYNKLEACLGDGHSSSFIANGNSLVVLERNLAESQNDTIRLYISLLEENGSYSYNNTLLLETEIPYKSNNTMFFSIYGHELHLYTYDENNPYDLVLTVYDLMNPENAVVYGGIDWS